VLCVGSLVVDLGKTVDAYPPLDHMATIDEVTYSTGGPGLNMAVDLRQLGARFPVGVAGAIGRDQNGDYVLAECRRLGIDTSTVIRTAGTATSFTDAMVERDGGRRTMFHHHGANAHFDAAAVDLAGSRARILHAGAPGIHRLMDAKAVDSETGSESNSDGENGWSLLLKRAGAAGMHTNMELVDQPPGQLIAVTTPCLPHLDSLVINELEAGTLTGIEAPTPEADGPVDWERLEAMARRLIDMGVSTVVVVHFPAGSVAAGADGVTWRQGSVRVPTGSIRSATGAGDAFAAGVIYGLHQQWSIERCLRLGAASAAACIQNPHTSAGISQAEECQTEADRMGYRSTTA
jgi:sugar/nucleoside kinase (ribokinase family)